jgi:hypothetical protein
MYHTWNSEEKENSPSSASNIYTRQFASKSSKKPFGFDDNDVEEANNDEGKMSPIVDEVHKAVAHIHKKDRTHIG